MRRSASLKNKKRRRNPVPPSSRALHPQVEQAADLYERFSGHDAEEIGRIDKLPSPDVLAVIGFIDFVGYTTVRDGRTEKYIHRFKSKSRPLFCVTPDGKQIVCIGGAYDFTERGIVDHAG